MAGGAGSVEQEYIQVTQIGDEAYAALDGLSVKIHCDLTPLTLEQKARLMRKLAERLDQVAEVL